MPAPVAIFAGDSIWPLGAGIPGGGVYIPGRCFPWLLVAPGGMFAGRSGAGLAGLSVAVPVPGAAPVFGRWPMPGAAYRPELRRLAFMCDRARLGRCVPVASSGVSPSLPAPYPRPLSFVKGGGLLRPGATCHDREELLPAWPPSLPGAGWHEFCHPSPPCVN